MPAACACVTRREGLRVVRAAPKPAAINARTADFVPFPELAKPIPPESAAKTAAGEHDWEPNFVDYLFLAFNTSTAFSPTDVPVLSRWAKILMMLQSLISLLVIALLAGRAVNIL